MTSAGIPRARGGGSRNTQRCSTLPSTPALAMGDDGGATGVAEPASAAAASQPSGQNQRRQSARLQRDEDPELVALLALTECQLPADSQRAMLDARPVEKEAALQVHTRVSCAARCFDHKDGIAWSRLTFGEGGDTTRIFGTVKELMDDSGGRNRKASTYRVAWDIAVPRHDSGVAANAHSLGRKLFTKAQLRREEPSAGRRLTQNLNGPYVAKPAIRRDLGLEEDADDTCAPLPKVPATTFVDASITDDEDDAWEPQKDSGGESDEEFVSPTEHADDLLLSLQPDIIDMGKWNTHDVTWSFGGCSQQAMDAAALPWTLDMTSPGSWGPAADPYRDGTITTTH